MFFFSLILTLMIAACGGSSEQQRIEGNNPSQNPPPPPPPPPGVSFQPVSELNERFKWAVGTKFEELEDDVQKAIRHHVANGHELRKAREDLTQEGKLKYKKGTLKLITPKQLESRQKVIEKQFELVKLFTEE